MKQDLRKKIIQEWTDNLPLKEKIIKLFEKVRDIPYGDIGSRDPTDVYEKNKGTCSGKHELLKELYKELGLKIKDFIVMHKFNDSNVKFPDEIREIFNRTEIIDPHKFFKIFIDNKWVIIDATWDNKLKNLGFIVNENWDGNSDMELTVKPIKILETESPIESKKEIIEELPEQIQKDRKLFLKKIN